MRITTLAWLSLILLPIMVPKWAEGKRLSSHHESEEAESPKDAHLYKNATVDAESQPPKGVYLYHNATGASEMKGDSSSRSLGSGNLIYHNGPVIANVKVVLVYWGGSSRVRYASNLQSFYGAITRSTWYNILSQYKVGSGSLIATYSDDAAPTGILSQSIVAGRLTSLISSGRLPYPDQNTYYAVHFVPGTRADSGQCSSSCAWHSLARTSSGTPIYYGANPDQDTCGPCTGGLNGLFRVSAHELAEAATDPDCANGWYDIGGLSGEIGDKCVNAGSTNAVGSDGNTYNVPLMWSNAAGGCVTGVSTPVAPPVSPPTSGKLGDWAVCSTSSQCNNQCCSKLYSGGIFKCTPLAPGFNPTANGCVGGSSGQLGDWASCSSSSQCANKCCSKLYSGGIFKCTPLAPGFNPSANGCT